MFSDGSVTLAVVAILGSAVAALVWVIKTMFDQVIPALSSLTKATDMNTRATRAADTYLRSRNGIDNEHHAETLKAIREVPKAIEAIKVAEQHVEFQHVEQEVVKKKA